MPLARCRCYDEDGNPIGRGCIRKSEGTCDFVHPDEEAWNRAPKSRFQSSRGRGSFRGRGRERNPSASWGHPPPDPTPKSQSGWDTSGWDRPQKKPDLVASTLQTNAGSRGAWAAAASSPTTNTTSGWASAWGTGGTEEKETEGSGWGGWSNSEGGGGGGGGWGAGDSGGGWGSSSGGGWGAGDSGGGCGGGGGGGGWGDAAGDIAKDAAGDKGWGVVSTTGSSIQGIDVKGKDKGPATGDNEWPTTMKAKVDEGQSKANNKNNAVRAPLPIVAVPSSSNLAGPSRHSASPAISVTLRAPVSLPRSHNSSAPRISELPKAATLGLKLPATSIRGGTDSSRKQRALLHFRGPKGRAMLYTSVVRNMQNVVRLHVDLKRALQDQARWKKTQDSKQYSHPTPATRVKLDNIRAEHSKKVTDAKKHLEHGLKVLLELPEFEKPPNGCDPTKDQDKLIQYTAELRDWIKDLELHKRLIAQAEQEKAAAAQLQAQRDRDSAQSLSSDKSSPVEFGPTAAALQERGTWSWSEIKAVLANLEREIRTTEEDVYMDTYTKYTEVRDVEDEMEGLVQAAIAEIKGDQPKPNEERLEKIAALSSSADGIGNVLGEQANLAAELIAKIRRQEEELAELNAENSAIEAMCKEHEPILAQGVERQKAADDNVEQLNIVIQSLHKRRRKVPPAPSVPTEASQIEEIMIHTRSIILEHLQNEVVPVLDAFRKACTRHNETLEEEIRKKLNPILQITEGICRRANAAVGSQRFIPPSQGTSTEGVPSLGGPSLAGPSQTGPSLAGRSDAIHSSQAFHPSQAVHPSQAIHPSQAGPSQVGPG